MEEAVTKRGWLCADPMDPAIMASDPWLGDFISKGIQRVELD